MQIRYLDISALKMAEAVLAQDPWMPDIPPIESLWLQPLAPLRFHGSIVKGIALYHTCCSSHGIFSTLLDPAP